MLNRNGGQCRGPFAGSRENRQRHDIPVELHGCARLLDASAPSSTSSQPSAIMQVRKPSAFIRPPPAGDQRSQTNVSISSSPLRAGGPSPPLVHSETAGLAQPERSTETKQARINLCMDCPQSRQGGQSRTSNFHRTSLQAVHFPARCSGMNRALAARTYPSVSRDYCNPRGRPLNTESRTSVGLGVRPMSCSPPTIGQTNQTEATTTARQSARRIIFIGLPPGIRCGQ